MSHLLANRGPEATKVPEAKEQTGAASTSTVAEVGVPLFLEADLDDAVISPELARRIEDAARGGRALAESERKRFEAVLGGDLADVRVHAGPAAWELAAALGARAFTFGRHVFIGWPGAGRADPGTLLVEELAHTLQDPGRGDGPRRVAAPDSTNEREARSAVEAAGAGRRWNGLPTPAQPGTVLRRPDFDPPGLGERTRGGASPRPRRPPGPTKTIIERIREELDTWWVGPIGEYELERLWSMFGSDLPASADKYKTEWNQSLQRGANPDNMAGVPAIKKKLPADVKGIAGGYLDKNVQAVSSALDELGLRGGRPDEEQKKKLEKLKQDAKKLKLLQKAEQSLRAIKVGWNWTEFSRGDRVEYPASFNPEKKPDMPPSAFASKEKMQPWEDVKVVHELTTRGILALASTNPVLYAAYRDGKAPELAGETTEDPAAVAAALLSKTLADIESTRSAVTSGDLDWHELKPIIRQLMQGERKGASGIDWSTPFHKGVVADEAGDYQAGEIAADLTIGLLAAVAFIFAEVLSGGLATGFLIGGVGLGVGNAARKWEKWDDLETAAGSSVHSARALVDAGQADDALIEAIIESVFAFLDVAGAAKRGAELVGAFHRTRAGRAALKATVEGMEGIGKLSPEAVTAAHKASVHQAIREVGVEAAARSAGLSPQELLARVGMESDAGKAIRAYLDLVEKGVNPEDLATALAGAIEGRKVVGKAGAELLPEEVVLQALDTLGAQATVDTAGGWTRLASAIPAESVAGLRLKAWRDGVYNDLRRFLATLDEGADAGESVISTGTQGSIRNDLDLSFVGPKASENRTKALQFLAGRLGANADVAEIGRLLDLGLFTDPRRIHLWDKYPELAEELSRRTSKFEEELIWNADYHRLLKENPGAAEKVARQMDALGVRRLETFKPLGERAAEVLARNQDVLYAKIETAAKAGDTAGLSSLLEELAVTQAQINVKEGGGYFSGGGVRRFVTEDPKAPFPGYRAGEALPPPPTMDLGAALDQVSKLRDAVAKLSGLTPPLGHAPADVTKALKSVAKYGDRFTTVAGILGKGAPAGLDELGEGFAELIAKVRSGAVTASTLDGALHRVQALLTQYDGLHLAVIKALRDRAAIAGMEDLAPAILAATQKRYLFLRFRGALLLQMGTAARLAKLAAPSTDGGPDTDAAVPDAPPPTVRKKALRPSEQATDALEREADAVAAKVLQASESSKNGTSAAPETSPPWSPATPDPGSGVRLPAPVRARIEPVLNADLGSVRVHDGADARRHAASVGARAFTHRGHIWLGAGESPGDLELMAHESAHVVQQRRGQAGEATVLREPDPGAVDFDLSGVDLDSLSSPGGLVLFTGPSGVSGPLPAGTVKVEGDLTIRQKDEHHVSIEYGDAYVTIRSKPGQSYAYFVETRSPPVKPPPAGVLLIGEPPKPKVQLVVRVSATPGVHVDWGGGADENSVVVHERYNSDPEYVGQLNFMADVRESWSGDSLILSVDESAIKITPPSGRTDLRAEDFKGARFSWWVDPLWTGLRGTEKHVVIVASPGVKLERGEPTHFNNKYSYGRKLVPELIRVPHPTLVPKQGAPIDPSDFVGAQAFTGRPDWLIPGLPDDSDRADDLVAVTGHGGVSIAHPSSGGVVRLAPKKPDVGAAYSWQVLRATSSHPGGIRVVVGPDVYVEVAEPVPSHLRDPYGPTATPKPGEASFGEGFSGERLEVEIVEVPTLADVPVPGSPINIGHHLGKGGWQRKPDLHRWIDVNDLPYLIATTTVDVGVGMIPIVGDVKDIGEFIYALATDRDFWGRPVTTGDKILMGIGAVLGLIPLVGGVGSLLRGALRGGDKLVDLARRLRKTPEQVEVAIWQIRRSVSGEDAGVVSRALKAAQDGTELDPKDAKRVEELLGRFGAARKSTKAVGPGELPLTGMDDLPGASKLELAHDSTAWRRGLSDETKAFLRGNPSVAKAYEDMSPTVRALLTKCASFCIRKKVPSKAVQTQIDAIAKTLDPTAADSQLLRTFFYLSDDLAGAAKTLARYKTARGIRNFLAKNVDVADAVLLPRASWRGNTRMQATARALVKKGVPLERLSDVMAAAARRGEGGERVLGYVEKLWDLKPRPLGAEHVIGDLAKGGNFFKGAEWVLRYLDRTDGWKGLKQLEVTAEGGGRRWDALLQNGDLIQFKSWKSFHGSTFVKQVVQDYNKTDGLRRTVRWIFEPGPIGEVADVRAAAKQAVRDALRDPDKAKELGLTAEKAREIIDKVDGIIEMPGKSAVSRSGR